MADVYTDRNPTLAMRFPFIGFDNVIVEGLAPSVAERYSMYRNQASKADFQSKTFAPLVHLSQSSGTGKSRSALELARLVPEFFLRFGEANGLPASAVASYLVDKLTAFASPAKGATAPTFVAFYCVLHIVMQRIMFLCQEMSSRRHFLKNSGLEGLKASLRVYLVPSMSMTFPKCSPKRAQMDSLNGRPFLTRRLRGWWSTRRPPATFS